VIVQRLRLRDFRLYAEVELALGPGLTVLHGANGAGKTNLLEALYFGCTGRSCRTTNEREVVRFGQGACRVEVAGVDAAGDAHDLQVGFQPGEAKRFRADGAVVERLLDAPSRPLVSVFLPDRLELVKGPPGLRRSHLDAVVTGLWPSRAGTRRLYSQALAQRNALLLRVRGGAAGHDALHAWDLELARHGVALRDDRARAVDLLVARFAALAAELGLAGDAELRYRPRSRAPDAAALAAELAERLPADLDRGFTTHGPHRDDLVLLRDGRDLRAYGSQGEQRLALLALLLAEREALAQERGRPPLILLDDVMSELDVVRRRRLINLLTTQGGQAVVTTTELAHVPDTDERSADAPLTVLVADGAVAAATGPREVRAA